MTDRAGIRDVANRAGVSVGTVSNVLNRPDLVAPATRQRVEDAVASLRYVRNESARQLRMGQSRTVGLIVPDVGNPFFTDVARGIEEVMSDAGVLTIVCNSNGEAEKEARYLTMMAEQHVLGVLHVPAGPTTSAARQLVDRDIPVVLLDHKGASRRQCSVSVNDVAGGGLALGHLLAKGHRSIAFVGSGHTAMQALDRLSGARAALVGAGRSADELQLLPTPTLNVQGGVAAARALLSISPRKRPTAVVCINDLLAIGMLQELIRSGIRIPEDVALVGYDDIAFAEAAPVPITSVRQPRNQLGRRAAELLLDEAANPRHKHAREVFEPELIIRESTG